MCSESVMADVAGPTCSEQLLCRGDDLGELMYGRSEFLLQVTDAMMDEQSN
jgi:hypothetical protein